MTYPCMSPDELRLWEAAAKNVRYRATRPCVDCPLWYAAEMRAIGRCIGTPRVVVPAVAGPPRLPNTMRLRRPQECRMNPYATDEERRAARRQSWRESKQRTRSRKAA